MIAKKFRLPAQQFPKGGYKKHSTPHFFLKAAPNHLGFDRFGIVVGVVVSKKATRRNFFKRRLSGALGHVASAGNDYLIILLPKASGTPVAQLQQELVDALKKISTQ